MPILMNKFYYFTLNYYCIYTSEDIKKFDIIPGSSLISIYISIWDFILSLIKSNIPDEYGTNDYNYFSWCIMYFANDSASCLQNGNNSKFSFCYFSIGNNDGRHHQYKICNIQRHVENIYFLLDS